MDFLQRQITFVIEFSQYWTTKLIQNGSYCSLLREKVRCVCGEGIGSGILSLRKALNEMRDKLL